VALITPHHPSPDARPDELPVQFLTRRLAAAGFGVEYSPRPDGCELTITGTPAGKSCLSVTAHGPACWHYEPTAGPATSPVTLTRIITYLLAAPHRPQAVADPGRYRAFPLKGQVGRLLQDQGLNVSLRVAEDWESFEATTTIDVTSPTRPWLGAVTMADNADLDWRCNYQTAFQGDAAALADVIIPFIQSEAQA
jgi:hypothetical protein